MRTTLSQVARRGAYLILIANAVSCVGSLSSAMALPLFVLEKTKNPFVLSIVVLVGTLPLAATTYLAGWLIDQGFRLRTISSLSDTFSAIIFLFIYILMEDGLLSPVILAVLLFVASCGGSAGAVARLTVFSSLARDGGWEINRANSSYALALRAAALLAPCLAWFLIRSKSFGVVIACDAASYLFSAAVVAGWVKGDKGRPQTSPGGLGARTEAANAGNTNWPRVTSWIAIVGFANIAINSCITMLLPMKAMGGVLQIGGYSLSVLAMGIGSSMGAFAARSLGRWPDGFTRGVLFQLVILSGFAGVFVILGASAQPLVWALTAGTGSFIVGLLGPLIMTIVAEDVAGNLKGQVFSVLQMIVAVGGALSAPILGGIGKIWGASAPSYYFGFLSSSIALVLAGIYAASSAREFVGTSATRSSQ